MSTPPQVWTILNQKVGRWLTDSRILTYEAILSERDDLILTTDNCVNPAGFLLGGETSEPWAHACLGLIDYQSKVRQIYKTTGPYRS